MSLEKDLLTKIRKWRESAPLNSRYPEQVKEWAVLARQAAVSPTKIARAVGCTSSVVKAWALRYGHAIEKKNSTLVAQPVPLAAPLPAPVKDTAKVVPCPDKKVDITLPNGVEIKVPLAHLKDLFQRLLLT